MNKSYNIKLINLLFIFIFIIGFIFLLLIVFNYNINEYFKLLLDTITKGGEPIWLDY